MSGYTVHKVLNNNVVISTDQETGQEIIVVGTGIGFGKKPGSHLQSSNIFKIYGLQDREFGTRLQKTLTNIPLECVELTEQIITMATTKLDYDISNGLLFVLADHINFAISTYRQGVYHPTILNEEIQRLYPAEYKVGIEAVRLINIKENISLPDSEASAIAFHIMDESSSTDIDKNLTFINAVSKLLAIISESMGISYDIHSREYYRLMIHIKYFLRSFMNGEQKKEDNSESFIKLESNHMKSLRGCLNRISKYLLSSFGREISLNEKFYLSVHILRLLQINQTKGE